MKLQLEAESEAVKKVAETERCKNEVVAIKAEMDKVVEQYKASATHEQNRAKLAEDHLHGSLKDFALIRENMSKEVR